MRWLVPPAPIAQAALAAWTLDPSCHPSEKRQSPDADKLENEDNDDDDANNVKDAAVHDYLTLRRCPPYCAYLFPIHLKFPSFPVSPRPLLPILRPSPALLPELRIGGVLASMCLSPVTCFSVKAAGIGVGRTPSESGRGLLRVPLCPVNRGPWDSPVDPMAAFCSGLLSMAGLVLVFS
jgi:hypothetical protein